MASYSTTVKRNDHFVPESSDDPATQRKLRGQLEQIDYTAFACNREIIAQTVGTVDAQTFQRLAVLTAHARATWVAEAMSMSNAGLHPSPDKVVHLAELHRAFEELSDAYESMRRLVERGYLTYRADKH